LKTFVTLLAFLFLVLFSGCSTKEVFEPTKISQDWSAYGESNSSLVELGSNIALLENGTILTKTDSINIDLNRSFRVITRSDEWIISSSVDGNLSLTSIDNSNSKIEFNLKKTIASASTHKDTLAVLFADNEMALYSISSKKLLFKEQGSKSTVVDSRVIPPYFMRGLILFSTLNGKVVIINEKLKKKLRTIIVSTEENFNNIIYFNVIDDKIIAATGTKMLSLAAKEIRVKYEIRNIVYDDKEIFITTKQGEIISLTPDLQVNAKIKLPLAHFLALIYDGEKLYLLENEGYMIVVDKNLKNYTVHPVDIEDGYIFTTQKTFFVGDSYISIDE